MSEPSKRQARFASIREVAQIQWDVDNQRQFVGDITVKYQPIITTDELKPCTIKFPNQFVHQLRGVPKQINGVPIEVLIRIAHFVIEQNVQETFHNEIVTL
jgi:hypothetical protein